MNVPCVLEYASLEERKIFGDFYWLMLFRLNGFSPENIY